MRRFGLKKKDIKVSSTTIFKEWKKTIFERVKWGMMIKSHQIENINSKTEIMIKWPNGNSGAHKYNSLEELDDRFESRKLKIDRLKLLSLRNEKIIKKKMNKVSENTIKHISICVMGMSEEEEKEKEEKYSTH